MSREILAAVVRWQNALNGDRKSVEITFHGGEPLVPGLRFYRNALSFLREGLTATEVQFGVQSNLWLLTEELCALFREYDVSLGTSLDGSETINDSQRGEGYFQRTMNGIERARTCGMNVGCICTFTKQSAQQAAEVFNFFVQAGLDFSIHAALPSLGHPNMRWTLSPEEYGQLLVDMLDHYLDNATRIRISTLDAMSRSVSASQGSICTFGDCLGKYLAVDPEGWIYSCQRFAGIEDYRLGHVQDCPTLDDLAAAPFWRSLEARQSCIKEACGDCPYLDFCRGGCPYNVLAANGGTFGKRLRDPYCPAYERVFRAITDRALEEIFSEKNMDAVVEKGPGQYGLMHKGRLLHIMRGGPHPREVARQARKVVAAVALAVSASPAEALQKLDEAGVVTRPQMALRSLRGLRRQLDTQSKEGLVNAYIHVTYDCNLHCTHCYARAGTKKSPPMAADDVTCLVRQAAEAGFHKAVITGGEPMMHGQRNTLLDALGGLREEVKPMQTVLRTNLAYPLPPALLARLARSTDQVVVSIDGDENSHDIRRGAGSYARTLNNLRTLLAADPTTDIGITAVLTAEQMRGQEAQAVQALGDELGVRVRLKSVLPLGCGRDLALTPAFYSSLNDEVDTLAYGTHIASTCGLGMNLYVGPEGDCYPCYALMGERHRLGNALEEGLASVLVQNAIYRQVTVDSNPRCCTCALRYVCGGFCRAWGKSDNPDGPPATCTALYERAQGLLLNALEVLNVSEEHWVAAGLPLS
jgi:uncharacterized protein